MVIVNTAREILSGVSHGVDRASINSLISNRGLTFGTASSLIIEQQQAAWIIESVNSLRFNHRLPAHACNSPVYGPPCKQASHTTNSTPNF
jgi:hypothetical protein